MPRERQPHQEFDTLRLMEQYYILCDRLGRFPLLENTWNTLRVYCSGEPATLGIRFETWDEKKEELVMADLFQSMSRDVTGVYAKKFTQFLEWVAVDPSVTDQTRTSVINQIESRHFVRNSTLRNSVMASLAEIVEKDWISCDERLPTFASAMLVTAAASWRYRDHALIDQVVRLAETIFGPSVFFNSMDGVYAVAEEILTDHVCVWNYAKTIQPYVRLYTFRRLLEYKAAGIWPEFAEFAAGVVAELDGVLSKFHRGEREAHNPLRATIGVELQYEGKKRLGLSKLTTEFSKTRLRRSDMVALGRYAGFPYSGDCFYEFPLPPTYTASMQSLMFTELERIQSAMLGKWTPMEDVTAQPNLGGIRYKDGVFDEPEDFQFILYCAGYGFRQNELSSREDSVTWGLFDPNAGSKSTMVFQRGMDDREVVRVGGHGRVVTEQRMPVIHSFAEGVRLFAYESDFSMLMGAHQKRRIRYQLTVYEKRLADLWDDFRTDVAHIFADHGFDFSRLAHDPKHREMVGRRVAGELRILHRGEPLAEGQRLLVSDLRALLASVRSQAIAIERDATDSKHTLFARARDILARAKR